MELVEYPFDKEIWHVFDDYNLVVLVSCIHNLAKPAKPLFFQSEKSEKKERKKLENNICSATGSRERDIQSLSSRKPNTPAVAVLYTIMNLGRGEAFWEGGISDRKWEFFDTYFFQHFPNSLTKYGVHEPKAGNCHRPIDMLFHT